MNIEAKKKRLSHLEKHGMNATLPTLQESLDEMSRKLAPIWAYLDSVKPATIEEAVEHLKTVDPMIFAEESRKYIQEFIDYLPAWWLSRSPRPDTHEKIHAEGVTTQ